MSALRWKIVIRFGGSLALSLLTKTVFDSGRILLDWKRCYPQTSGSLVTSVATDPEVTSRVVEVQLCLLMHEPWINILYANG